jgi:hypothetical protein
MSGSPACFSSQSPTAATSENATTTGITRAFAPCTKQFAAADTIVSPSDARSGSVCSTMPDGSTRR